MSTFAGVTSKHEARTEWCKGIVRTMAERAYITPPPSAILSSGNAVFGAAHNPDAHLVRHDTMLVVWTGFLTNRTECTQVLGIADGTLSDGEIIANLVSRFGFPDSIVRCHGEIALALYDSRSQELWIARDRFGTLPLYYLSTSQCFAFSSRPLALTTIPGASRTVNSRFVSVFASCHYRYIDNAPEESPFRDVRQVPAGHFLRQTPDRIEVSRYWGLAESEDFTTPESELADEYSTLLRDAVSRRMLGAGRPGFTLSGGMDSSSVIALAASISGRRQHAFSTVYSDKTYDESEEIRPMLESIAEPWDPICVDAPDVFTIVSQMVRLHDEPVATATWLSHFTLCRTVAEAGCASLFGGLGGDELNAGEYEYFFFYFADLRAAGEEARLRQEVKKWVEYHDHPIYRKSFEAMESGVARWTDSATPGACRVDDSRLTRYRSALRREYFPVESFAPRLESPFRSYLKNRTYQDLFFETAPCCLRAQERHATAFGLRSVSPFFDHRLAEFMFRVPGGLKIRDGVTKILLRSAMKGVLPEETRLRVKKTGWNAPAHLWFSGKGREALLDLVRSREFRERGVYDALEVERIIAEHERIVSGGLVEENHMMFLWQLLNVELWLRDIA